MPSREKRSSNMRVLLLLGLDASGTTTILYQIAWGKRMETIPTLDFNTERVRYGELEYQIWDIGGLDKMRPLWRQYSREADGIIFAVDAANRTRFSKVSEELKKFFGGKKGFSAQEVPLLIFANKQDLPNAASAEELEEAIECRHLPVKSYKVVECCAITGESLDTGLDWMTDQLQRKSTPKR